MSVALIRDGEVVFARGYGLAVMEHGIPNDPATIFRIGSTSKQFTAACIALLVLEGNLNVQDEVRKHFPELRSYGEPLRIQHLIHHTSGIRDYIGLLRLAGHPLEGVAPEESLVAIARQESLLFSPGERFEYSNSNYLLLGEIVARVSGQSLAAFAQERIFDPLKMSSTHFHDRHDHVVPGRTFGYSPADGEFALDITTFDHVGDGGVFTTVEDLALWDANFYEPKVGGPAFLELMHTRGRLNDGTELGYAFGLFLGDHRGHPSVSHGGAWVGYRAELMRFPERRMSVVCLANRGDVNPTLLCARVADRLLEELPAVEAGVAEREAASEREDRPAKPAPPPEPDAGQAEAYVGIYWSPELAVEFGIAYEEGRLTLARPRSAPARLEIVEPDVFEAGDVTLRFRRDAQGDGVGFALETGTFGAFRFGRR